jgi:hypothetical protein
MAPQNRIRYEFKSESQGADRLRRQDPHERLSRACLAMEMGQATTMKGSRISHAETSLTWLDRGVTEMSEFPYGA